VPTIFLSAGEPSGDLHGAAVARALRARWPDARLLGLGGPRMQEAGVQLLAHVDDLAILGYVEVARHLPFFLQLLKQIRQILREQPPQLVLPIDYPGFNFRLARAARRAGVPVLYYIAPQVWAWRRHRMRELAATADHLAVILPFEEELFRAAGARATFVGHPLLDRPPTELTRDAFAQTVGADATRPILALFPGSREQEVARHGRLFIKTAEWLERRAPGVQPLIAAGGAVPADAYANLAMAHTADSWALLHHATAALVKSGTSTVEAALSGTPLVVAYRLGALTFQLVRRLVRVEHVGLVNLVAGERIAPELIQEEATPERLGAALLPLLDPESPERRAALAGLIRVRERLRRSDTGETAAERVAGLAAQLLEGQG
jgi:lipid-A-disaccharide synthase